MAAPVTYVTAEELAEYIGGRYDLSVDTGLLLRDASRLVDNVTIHKAFYEWRDPLPDPLTDEQSMIKEAVCAQIEYWLEIGTEQSVDPQTGPVQIAALSLPDRSRLAPKAREALNSVGLLYRGVPTAGWQ